MKLKIEETIKALEKERGICVLLACESGSRAWGFPSQDSQYDVRLIYMHKKDWYISLYEKKDTINLIPEGNVLDIHGWDIRKALNLLYRSNATLIERLQSPIVYTADEYFMQEVSELLNDLYSPISVMYHYLSLTKKMMNELGRETEHNLKKLFCTLRSALTCKWILDNSKCPPINIQDLMMGIEIPKQTAQRIRDLIQLKSSQKENYLHRPEPGLIQYIQNIIRDADQGAAQLAVARNKAVDLNTTFVNWVKKCK